MAFVPHHSRPYNLGGPTGYLLTMRCYGTWLHGDARSSVDRKGHNIHGQPRLAPSSGRVEWQKGHLTHPPVYFNAQSRRVVDDAIRVASRQRDWVVYALNVQRDHVHVVLSTSPNGAPNRMLAYLKARATFALRGAGLLDEAAGPWSHHGSTVYCWTEEQLNAAIGYVLFNQPLPPEMM